MAHRRRFFLDAGRRLAGSESAPVPDEAGILNAAMAALRDQAAVADHETVLRVPGDPNRCGSLPFIVRAKSRS